jgi:VWFA-related protein
MMRTRRLTAALLGVLLAIGTPGPVLAQDAPQPIFRATTRLVVLSVTVTDDDGNPVEGLTAADFVVTENGQPQEIAFAEFQRMRAAATAAGAATSAARLGQAEPTVPAAATTVDRPTLTEIAAPPGGDIRYQDRRLLVFYFDTSAMQLADSIRAYTNALTYIDTQMSPADLVSVMAFRDGAVQVRSDFTDDRDRLREVITLLLYNDDLDGDGIADITFGSDFGQNSGEFVLYNTNRQLSALQTAASMLRPLPERKTLILFTGGLNLRGADNQAQYRATINEAIRANVTLNPIDARGLVAEPPLGDATRRSPGGSGAFTGALAASTFRTFQQSQDTLYSLAADTGGEAMFDYNDLSLGIVQAANAVTDYYILGYYSANDARDGRFRRVDVSLTGDRDYQLVHHEGYYADKEWARFNDADKERQLEEALMLDNPITEINLAMEVNWFQLNRAEYFTPVAVKIPGSELALAQGRGAARTLIDFIGEVKDDYGYTIQNIRDRLELRLDQETAAQLATRPIQYETGFTLLPGKYVLKILARDSTTGRIGTFQTAFEIPNQMREETWLPTSTVVLGSQRIPMADALLTVQDGAEQTTNPLVYDGQKLFPSVTRVFNCNRLMYVYLQAYEREAETTRPLVAFVSFFQEGRKVLETQPLAVTEGLFGRANAVPLRFAIPLDSLPPGRYDTQVSVIEPGGQKVAFWQGAVALVE